MSANPVSRRNFLKIAGLSQAGSVVACSGLGFLAALSPSLDTSDLTYGKESAMNQRILITFTTLFGGSVQISRPECISK